MKLDRKVVIELGREMKEARTNKEMSMEQVKIKLETMGIKINKSDLQRLEKGERLSPNPLLLNKLCSVYGLDTIKFFKEIGYLNKSNELETSINLEVKTTKVPLYGTASAGPGYINLSEEVEDFIIPKKDYKPGRFTVNVEGDSMMGLKNSIPDGAVALTDPTMCGDIEELTGKVCVFTYNDETFIKQLIIDKQNLIHLTSFNPEVQDIIVLDPKNLKCEGRVVRTYFEQKW